MYDIQENFILVGKWNTSIYDSYIFFEQELEGILIIYDLKKKHNNLWFFLNLKQ
jgi:hypothetical protein